MDTIDTIFNRPSRGRAKTGQQLPSALHQAARRLGSALGLWIEKRASRRILRDLTDSELLDIGLTRSQARKEVGKSFFWD